MRRTQRWIGVVGLVGISTLTMAARGGEHVSVPPGEHTYVTQGSADGPIRLVFGGSPQLQIHRVVTASGVDVEFAGADPHDATRFFRENPLPPNSGDISILVENAGTQSLPLSVVTVAGQ